MTKKAEHDFAAAWQQFVGQWERQINELSTTVSGSELFAGPMNHAAKFSLAARQSMDEAAEKMLQASRIATQSQMLDVLERLDRIEQALDQIADRLKPPPLNSAAAAQPRRTRRPPGDPA